MKREIREVDAARGILQITCEDERFYARRVSADGTEHNRQWQFVPSVTWITGYYPKDKRFIQWVGRVGNEGAEELKQSGGEKGTKVHQAVGVLLGGGTVNFQESMFENRYGEPEELNAAECEAVLSFVEWFKKTNPEVIAWEFTVWSERHRYAGTVDLYCRINGVTYIIDFKISPNIYPAYEIQVSAYKHSEVRFPKNTRLAILQLGYNRNKHQKYKFTAVKDQFQLFLAARRIWEKECGDITPYQREYPIEVSLNPQSKIVGATA